MVKGLIFDFDGTIVDSMGVWKDFGRRFLEKHGIAAPPDIDDIIYTFDLEQSADYFASHFDMGMDVEGIKRATVDFVDGYYANDVYPKPGAVEFIRRMRSLGMRVCVATASMRAQVESAARHGGFFDLIDFFLTTDEVGAHKDRPDIFLQCAERMGLQVDECVVLEDSLFAARTAKAAGFRIVGVHDENNPPESTEGLRKISDWFTYDFSGLPEQLTGR